MIPESLKDPRFTFDEERHLYFFDGEPLTSVSAWKKKYKDSFDSGKWAAVKARERGTTPEVIVAEWAANGQKARDLGTEVHNAIERFLDGKPLGQLSTEAQRRFALFSRLLDGRLKGAKILAQELRTYSLKLKHAGTLDFLLQLPNGRLYIGDWKTNRKFTHGAQGFGYLREPFSDLKNNHLNEYALQLSAYKVFLEEHGLMVDGTFIAYLGPDAKDPLVFFPPDLSDRVREEMENEQG